MSLTTGSGPFGRHPAGTFNFAYEAPAHVLYFEDHPRRVRAEFNGEVVADSAAVKLLHETGLPPVYYFPEGDVRGTFLEDSDHTTTCPFKGEASYFSLVVGDRRADDAVWYYPEPMPAAPPLSSHLAFYWDRIDRWFEEDEEVFVHPRDPYTRVDVLDSSRDVRVEVAGETVAASERARVLFETGLPPRYYLPPEDVRQELLVASDTHTRCPYKGTASYHSLKVPDGDVAEDLLWYYPEPLPEAAGIAGRYAFFDERVDLYLDGEFQQRPRTRWSPS